MNLLADNGSNSQGSRPTRALAQIGRPAFIPTILNSTQQNGVRLAPVVSRSKANPATAMFTGTTAGFFFAQCHCGTHKARFGNGMAPQLTLKTANAPKLCWLEKNDSLR